MTRTHVYFGVALILLTARRAAAQTPDTTRAGLDSASVRRETTAMKSYLRNLLPVQEAYFVDHSRYTSERNDLAQLQLPDSVKIATLTANAAGTGWAIVVQSTRLPKMRCGLAVNAVNPVDTTAAEGVAACK